MKDPNRSTKPLWIALGAVLVGTFLILGLFGREVYRQAPPIPARVVTQDGREITTGEQILDGQQVWQSIGGQQIGSVWGHGAYQAPDWSADWLHREAVALPHTSAFRDSHLPVKRHGPARQIVTFESLDIER